MSSAVDNLAGRTIRGYQLIELIGQGGFGAVYRAWQPLVAREAAVKIILPQFANHIDFIRRFDIEAQLIARLEHPFIVPLYDYWREPDGAYLIMRYLRGGSVRKLLEKGALQVTFVNRLLSQIATALTIAHRAGVVHRDLKPDNILLDEQGNAYLTDFGIAKDLMHDSKITEPEAVIGSFAYTSPEQLESAAITPRTDIFCLGLVLYEMLAGTHPFPKEAIGPLLDRLRNEPLPSLRPVRPDIPSDVDAVIAKATAKDPAARYTTVMEMAAAFRRAVRGRVATVEPDDALDALMTQDAPISLQVDATVGEVQVPVGSRTSTASRVLTPEPLNPYQGLRAFQEADADDFFGREAFIAALIKRLAETGPGSRFLAVVGPSGIGKSSVIRAGLIPALRRSAIPGSRAWFIREMFPGAYPAEELETALLRIAVNPPDSLLGQLQEDDRGLLRAVRRVLPEDGELLLLIDQFEELFTLTTDERARTHFLDSLYKAVTDGRSQLRVVITLRTDFYGHLLQYPEFSAMLRARTEVIMPMTEEELRQAIIAPAARVGVSLEQGLADLILADVKDQPGALPLVQYALTELFERRARRTMTIASYRESGGVRAALARRAEELYGELNADGQRITRQLFLRLVTLGEGVEDTRRRVQMAELLSIGGNPDATRAIITNYGYYRLLTFDRDPVTREPTVEVAHEALIREWERVREWVNASREDIRLQRRVAAAAAEWIKTDRDPSFLATGVRLNQLETFMAGANLALSAEETEYIRASIAERERREAEEQARIAYEESLELLSRRRLRSLVAVLTASTVIAIFLSLFAFGQQRLAGENAATATVALGQAQIEADRFRTQVSVAATSESVARAQKLAAERSAEAANSLRLVTDAQRALTVGDSELALALALEANRVSALEAPPPPVVRMLYEAAYAPGIRRIIGESAAAGDAGNAASRGPVRAVAISPDGKQALSGGEQGVLHLWDLGTGALIRTFEGHSAAIWTVAFSPDGRYLLSGAGRPRLTRAERIASDNTLRLWDVSTGALIRTFEGHTDAVTNAQFNSAGSLILSGSADGTLILWDIASGRPVRTYRDGHTEAITAVGFGVGEESLFSAGADRQIVEWRTADGAILRRFTGHGAQINTLAVSPNRRLLLSGAGTDFSRPEEFVIIVWDAMTGQEVRRLRGHAGPITSVVFDPDGQTAVSASADRQIIHWDVRSGTIVRRFTRHTSDVLTVAFSPTRHAVLSGGGDGQIFLWDIASAAEERRYLAHSSGVTGLALSPDNRLMVSSSADNTLILWDTGTGRVIRRLEGHIQAVLCVAISPDGRYIASGSVDKSIIIWNIDTGQIVSRLRGHIDRVNSLTYNADGSLILSGAAEGNLILWDVRTGQEIRRFLGHRDAVLRVALSPDGKQAVSAGADARLIVWDVASGTALRELNGHTERITALAYRPQGDRVLSGDAAGNLFYWNVATGMAEARWQFEEASITALALNGAGDVFAVGDAMGRILVGRMDNAMPVYVLKSHEQSVLGIVFRPDDQMFVSSSLDRSLILWWQHTPTALKAWLSRERHLRALTCAERVGFSLSPGPECPQ